MIPTKFEKRTYTIPEAAQVLGISKNLAYDMAAENKIPVIRLGKRVLVPMAMLNRFLDNPNSLEEGSLSKEEQVSKN